MLPFTMLCIFKKKWFLIVSITVLAILLITGVFIILNIFVFQKAKNNSQNNNTDEQVSEAVKKGMSLSNNKCEGKGSVVLKNLPMKEEDFAFITPYGLMVGAHVTPIDHQYFEPTNRALGRDSYPVYAMADGKIVDMQHRLISSSNTDEYRIVFAHTCTFFTYFDLVTSLAPRIKGEFDKNNNNNYASVNIDVKAGELIGYIGGQTLDFAVWNTENILSGFVVPSHYESEAWKIHTTDPYPYYSEELKAIYLKKILHSLFI